MAFDDEMTRDQGPRRAVGPVKGWPSRAGLGLVAAAALASTTPAWADPVSVEDDVPCSKNCVDTYEAKCPKASRILQFTLEAILDDDDDYGLARFQMTAVGTLPTSMDSQDFARIAETVPGQNPKTTFFVRPGPEGVMKAIVAVSPVLNGAPTPSYRLTAECFSGETLGDFVSKKTMIEKRRDQ
jgi:hypothetical protein